jgi:hypothetical protein
MDEDFLRDRALYIRSLADKADPFIRKRLLNLAAAYEKGPEAIRSAGSGHGKTSLQENLTIGPASRRLEPHPFLRIQ